MKRFFAPLILCFSILAPSFAPAQIIRPFTFTNEITGAQGQPQSVSFFQGESLQLNLRSLLNHQSYSIPTNAILRYDVTAKTNSHTLWISQTGTVISATNGTSYFAVSPESANLAPGGYNGYVRMLQYSGTNLVQAGILQYQNVQVSASPDASGLPIIGPIPGVVETLHGSTGDFDLIGAITWVGNIGTISAGQATNGVNGVVATGGISGSLSNANLYVDGSALQVLGSNALTNAAAKVAGVGTTITGLGTTTNGGGYVTVTGTVSQATSVTNGAGLTFDGTTMAVSGSVLTAISQAATGSPVYSASSTSALLTLARSGGGIVGGLSTAIATGGQWNAQVSGIGQVATNAQAAADAAGALGTNNAANFANFVPTTGGVFTATSGNGWNFSGGILGLPIVLAGGNNDDGGGGPVTIIAGSHSGSGVLGGGAVVTIFGGGAPNELGTNAPGGSVVLRGGTNSVANGGGYAPVVITNCDLVVSHGGISAGTYVGDGTALTGVLHSETDPAWTTYSNQVLATINSNVTAIAGKLDTNAVVAGGGGNVTVTNANGKAYINSTGGGGAGSQTPWTNNVSAAGFNLNDVNILSLTNTSRIIWGGDTNSWIQFQTAGGVVTNIQFQRQGTGLELFP